MQTLFLRPSPKDLESRMDLEVSSCLKDCVNNHDYMFGSCPSLSPLHIKTFAIIQKLAQIPSSHKWYILPLCMGHKDLIKFWTNSESCCLVACVLKFSASFDFVCPLR